MVRQAFPDPPTDDPVVARAAEAIGGPIGRLADHRAGWWTPIRVLLGMTCLTLLLAYAEKSPCASGRWVNSLQYTHFCYSDVIPLWSAEGLSDGSVPYRDHAVEYPVLTGGFMYITAELTRGWHDLAGSHLVPGTDETIVFGVATCLLLSICGLVTVAATAGAAGPRRRWDAAIVGLSPLLVFHAFSNWDLLAMSLTSAALWAWARGRPIATGALIGLGTAAKLYPMLLVLPLGIIAVRTGRWRPFAFATGTAVGVWIATNGPIALTWTTGWKEFYVFSSGRPAEASTFWAMAKYYWPRALGSAGSQAWTPPGLAVGLAVCLALGAVLALGLAAPQQPRVAQLAFLTVVGALFATKVWSPQYSVWLIPLIALARPRWRLVLVWQASEIAVWIGTLLWLLAGATPNHALNYQGLTVILAIRDVALLTLAGNVVWEILRPEHDVVRRPHDPDPGGGLFCDPVELSTAVA
jgi:uncharacterized membrane protein